MMLECIGRCAYLFPISLLVANAAEAMRPLVISSEKMLRHRPTGGYHPECPERITSCLHTLEEMSNSQLIRLVRPSAESSVEREELALSVIRMTHSEAYIHEVKIRCEKGARILDPFDQDTYISRHSFDQTVHAQSAWIDGVDEVLKNKNMAFAVVRPPGHHALKDRSMGFCIFNHAAGAANYALNKLGLQRVGILDFDVHYGNGVAAIVRSNPKIRYTSLHQELIFPGDGLATERGDHNNVLNIPLPAGTNYSSYAPHFVNESIRFLQEFDPDLVIVCAGFDGLGSDEIASLALKVSDYHDMALEIKKAFGPAVLFGLEGGYNLQDLPKAVQATLLAFTETPAG